MRTSRAPWPRRLLSLVATTLLAAPLVGVLAPSAHATRPEPATAAKQPATAAHADVLGTPAAEDSQGLSLAITEITPGVLTTEDHVRVRGTLTNTTDATLTAPHLVVAVQGYTPATTGELTDYLSGKEWDGWQAATVGLDADLPAGATASFSIDVPASAMPLWHRDQWGPRGVAVTATAGAARATDRTLLVWDPGEATTPQPVTVLLPWSRMDSQVNALSDEVLVTAQIPGVTLGIDPSIVAAGQSGALPDLTARTETRALERLGSNLGEVVALARHDADTGLLAIGADSGASPATGTPLLEAALASRDELATALTSTRVRSDVLWPAATTFSTAALQVAAAHGEAALIAPTGIFDAADDAVFPSPGLSLVDPATGAAMAPGASDGLLVASAPAALTDLLASSPDSPADRLDTLQFLTATGALAAHRGATSPWVVALPRLTHVDGPEMRARLKALLDQRWVHPATLSEALAAEPSDITGFTVTGGQPSEEATDALTHVTEALATLAPLTAAAARPEEVRVDYTDRALSALSASLAPTSQLMRALSLHSTVSNLTTAVHAEPSATINLINKSANFPVRIVNDLDWDVTVRVSLTPSDPRLRVEAPAEVVVPARASAQAEVPVRAIGSGDILVGYVVRTPAGNLLDDSQQVSVRMRAGWEDAGTLVVATLLAIAFLSGLVRTVRRRRGAAHSGANHAAPVPRPETATPSEDDA